MTIWSSRSDFRFWRAKISRILERSSALRIPGFRLDLEIQCLETGGQNLSLTKTQTAILQPLFEAYPHPVSADRISRAILARTALEMSQNTISARISGLRKILRPSGLILSGSWHMGYRIEAE